MSHDTSNERTLPMANVLRLVVDDGRVIDIPITSDAQYREFIALLYTHAPSARAAIDRLFLPMSEN